MELPIPHHLIAVSFSVAPCLPFFLFGIPVKFLHRKVKLIFIICCFPCYFFFPLKITLSSSAYFFVLLCGTLKDVNLELSPLVSDRCNNKGNCVLEMH